MNIALKEFNNIVGIIEQSYHEASLILRLSDSEFDMFYVIAAHGNGCNQSLLYKETGMRKSTVNTSIRKLEKQNILYLEPGDGRNTKVCLTDKGMEYLHRVEQIIDIENKIYHSWRWEEQHTFMELNKRYANQFKEAIKNLAEGAVI